MVELRKTRFVWVGASGRMGLAFKNYWESALPVIKDNFECVALLSRTDFLENSQRLEELPDFDVLIDFSCPEMTLRILDFIEEKKKAVLLATTGFSEEQSLCIEERLKGQALLWASNCSWGIQLMKSALRGFLPFLDAHNYQAVLYDLHHKHKKDAPSGTALELKNFILKYQPELKLDIHAARVGSEVGEHRICFYSQGESFELKHHAQDRSLFVEGALKMAQKLCTKPAGVYRPEDFI